MPCGIIVGTLNVVPGVEIKARRIVAVEGLGNSPEGVG
jgi:hypothetical protein